MKLSSPLLAVCVLSLAACDAASDVEPEATLEAAPPASTEVFTPHEVTTADIPPDIHEDSWARLPTITRESLDAEWSVALNQIAMALVHHEAGDETQARQLLDAARRWRDEKQQQAVDGVVDVQVIDWLAVHALLREAEAALD